MAAPAHERALVPTPHGRQPEAGSRSHIDGLGPMMLRAVGVQSPTPTRVDMGTVSPQTPVERARTLITPRKASRELWRAWHAKHEDFLRPTELGAAADPRDRRIIVSNKLRGLRQHELRIERGELAEGTPPDRSNLLTVDQAVEAAGAVRTDILLYAAHRTGNVDTTGQVIGKPELFMSAHEQALAESAAEYAMQHILPEPNY